MLLEQLGDDFILGLDLGFELLDLLLLCVLLSFCVCRVGLWFVGKLTSVPNRLAPIAMVLLLVLVFAYHPVISPTPMPTGLLVLVTLAMAALAGSILMLRWEFDSARRQVLSRLQAKLWEIREQDVIERRFPNTEKFIEPIRTTTLSIPLDLLRILGGWGEGLRGFNHNWGTNARRLVVSRMIFIFATVLLLEPRWFL